MRAGSPDVAAEFSDRTDAAECRAIANRMNQMVETATSPARSARPQMQCGPPGPVCYCAIRPELALLKIEFCQKARPQWAFICSHIDREILY